MKTLAKLKETPGVDVRQFGKAGFDLRPMRKKEFVEKFIRGEIPGQSQFPSDFPPTHKHAERAYDKYWTRVCHEISKVVATALLSGELLVEAVSGRDGFVTLVRFVRPPRDAISKIAAATEVSEEELRQAIATIKARHAQ